MDFDATIHRLERAAACGAQYVREGRWLTQIDAREVVSGALAAPLRSGYRGGVRKKVITVISG